jgi:uncharacterized protein (TIGR02284 family)
MTIPENDIGILNTLIDATTDSADSYREAADCLKDDDLRTVFQRRATERKIIAANLLQQLEALGGHPADSAIPASAHRVFNDLPGAARTDRPAVIDEVKRGEHRIEAIYRDAVDNSALSERSLTVVRNAFHSVRAGIDDTSKVDSAVNPGSAGDKA